MRVTTLELNHYLVINDLNNIIKRHQDEMNLINEKYGIKTNQSKFKYSSEKISEMIDIADKYDDVTTLLAEYIGYLIHNTLKIRKLNSFDIILQNNINSSNTNENNTYNNECINDTKILSKESDLYFEYYNFFNKINNVYSIIEKKMQQNIIHIFVFGDFFWHIYNVFVDNAMHRDIIYCTQKYNSKKKMKKK